jgi:uncharacterized OsmC-like protein
MKATQETSKVNGLDTEQMGETVNALKQDPVLAQFEFRNSNQWVSGGENRSTIQGFYGAGQEDTSRSKPFVFTNGEPPVLLGGNEGANPVEFILHAMAGCVTTTTVVHATARGIKINRIATRLVGNLDLQGFLGLDESVPVQYEKINIEMEIDADASDEEIDELIQFALLHSPACSTVSQPVPITLKRV